MKEGYNDSFPIKNSSAQEEGEEIIYDIPEENVISAIERVHKETGLKINKDVIDAIIKDMAAWNDQKKSFKESRYFSMKRWAKDYSRESWKAVLSIIGILYPRPAKKKDAQKESDTKEEKKDAPGKGYKDWY